MFFGLFTELRLTLRKEERFFTGIPQQNTGISTPGYAKGRQRPETNGRKRLALLRRNAEEWKTSEEELYGTNLTPVFHNHSRGSLEQTPSTSSGQAVE